MVTYLSGLLSPLFLRLIVEEGELLAGGDGGGGGKDINDNCDPAKSILE